MIHVRSLPVVLASLASLVFLLSPDATLAQSARRGAQPPSRYAPQPGSETRPGSTTRPAPGVVRGSQGRSLPVALEGYCAVCLRDMNKWVKGTTNHQVVYDGKAYLFPGAKQKALFEADPAKYLPVLGGDCAVCFASGARSPGNIRLGVSYQGRFYFFPNEDHKRQFKADPDKYVDADLALGGECPVCRVEMKERVPGKPEFTAIFGGLRYQFPGEEQREMFLANPQKYDLKK